MKLTWNRFSPGVWRAETGSEPITLTGLSGVDPAPGLREGPEADFPVDVEADETSEFLVLRIPLSDEERIFGCGLRFHSIVCRNTVVHLRADHYHGNDDGRTHAPVPFFVSTGGYGFFADTPDPVSIYIGTTQRLSDKPEVEERDRATDPQWRCYNSPEFVEIAIRSKKARLVVFAGGIGKCVARFNLYCGGGFIPPKWGLKLWHRTGMSMTGRDVLALVGEYEKRKFPLGVIGLEPGWQSNSYPCSYEWSTRNFPEPEKLLDDLKQRGIRVNLWENPYISEKSELFRELKPFSADHLVWGGIVPDYTLEPVRSAIKRHHAKHHLALGVGGYKLDESDGYDCWLWPDHARFPSGTPGASYRNLCGLLFERITSELYRENGRRTCGLTRSGNAGGCSFPYVLYNDRYDFREYLAGLCSCGFAGVLWTPEVRTAANGDEFLRRIQLAALSPMLVINAWADNTVPWSFPEVEDAVRAALALRTKLTPYLYSAFARYHFEGVPPYRSLFMDYGYFLSDNRRSGKLDSTKNPYQEVVQKDITDQFLLGDSLMAAPLEPGKRSRTVLFPPGKWFDFHTGEFVSDGGAKTIEVPENAPLPLFAPDGAVVPLEENGRIEIRHFGTKPGEFVLYDDDGESFDYERGKFTRTVLKSDGSRQVETVPGAGMTPRSE